MIFGTIQETKLGLIARIVGTLAFSAFSIPLASALPLQSAGRLTKADAEGLLREAESKLNLRSSDSPGFHIQLKTNSYSQRGDWLQGIYELWWASQNEWREEIGWGDEKAVTFAKDGRIWRTADPLRLDSERVRNLIDFVPLFEVAIRSGTLRSSPGTLSSGVDINCIRAGKNSKEGFRIARHSPVGQMVFSPNELSFCFNAENLPLTISTDLGDLAIAGYEIIGGKAFPKSVSKKQEGRIIVSAELILYLPLDATEFARFQPPAAAQSMDWCPDISLPEFFGIWTSPGVNFEASGDVFRISAKGKVIFHQGFVPGRSIPTREIGKGPSLFASKFMPAKCHKKHVDTEFFMLFP